MSEEHLIIEVYCVVEETCKKVVGEKKLRKRGPSPALTDSEVLTIVTVGEYLGLGSDKKIWSYFKRHWHEWFPNLGCRTSFVRQSANLLAVLDQMQNEISDQLCDGADLFLFDGFQIPLCHIRRYKRSGPFKGIAAVGYCAAKDQKCFGFKGHLLISHKGVARALSVTPANVDERDVLPETTQNIKGDVIADKGLIRPELTRTLAGQRIALHTPLRRNMHDSRPPSFVARLMDIRRKVETVIGQLVDRSKIQDSSH